MPTKPDPQDRDRRRGRTVAGWGVLLLLAVFSGVQAAGLVLRDRLDGRERILSSPPPSLDAAAQVMPDSSQGEASRFGPDVREVVVASVPGAPPQAKEQPAPPAKPQGVREAPPLAPTGGTVENPPQAVASKPAERSIKGQGPEPGEQPSSGEEIAPEPARGDFVLQVGVFRSQIYRNEMEHQLSDLGIRHFRLEGTRQGQGFRVAVDAQTEQQRALAGSLFESAGLSFRKTPEGLEAFFYEQRVASRTLDALTRQGLKGGYGKVDGAIPFWTVLAGPFSESEAKEVRQRLDEAGLKSNLRKR